MSKITDGGQPIAQLDVRPPPPEDDLSEAEGEGESSLVRHLPRTFDALLFGPFRWYLSALIFWNAAMSMQMLTRGYLAYDLTDSFTSLGVLSLASALPMLALSPFGGVLADRLSRRVVLQVGQGFGLLMALAVATLIFAGQLTFQALFLASVGQGTMMALVMPSRQAFLPEVVGMRRLMNAIPLQSASMNLMQIIAPAAGGFMIDWIGAGPVYVAMAVMYALSMTTLFAVKSLSSAEFAREADAQAASTGRRRGNRGASRGGGRGTALNDLASGFRYLFRNPVLLSVLSFTLLGSVLGMPIRRLLPGYVADVFADSGTALGVMQMGMGLGALAGALALATVRFDRNRGLVFAGSALLMGTSLLLFSFTGVFWLAWIALALVGVGTSGRQALGQMLMQDYVDDEYRGRVMSIYMMQISLMNVGTFFVSLYMDRVGPEFAIGSLGATLIVATIAYLTFVPRFRRLA
ncbi:MAG: MFS transporter [Dehalococcoidia bacterium]